MLLFLKDIAKYEYAVKIKSFTNLKAYVRPYEYHIPM